MFPRPRKITRLVVFTLIVLFFLSTYVYIFGSSDHATYETAQLVQGSMGGIGRSVLHADQHLLSQINQQGTDSAGKNGSQIDSIALGEAFRNRIQSKLLNSNFFRERWRTIQAQINSSKNSNSTFDRHTPPTTHSPSHVNPHDFAYLNNPSELCSHRTVSFLVYIHSSPGNLKKRQAIRQSWGDLRLLSIFNATLVFILGATPETSTQRLVNLEANTYGDIVQEDFVDAYRNLTYKGMTALKWVSTFCHRAAFVLKADDDILLDIVSVIDYLVTKVIPARGAKKLVLCNLWTRMRTMRNPKSKWFLSKEEFPQDVFPPYCSGSFFILSSDIIPDMYRTALNSNFFWVDDYFITGVLVNSLRIKHEPFNQAYLLNYNIIQDRLKNDKKDYFVFHIKQLSLYLEMWPYIVKRHVGMNRFVSNYRMPFSRTIFNNSLYDRKEGVSVRKLDVTSLKPVMGTNEAGLPVTGYITVR